MLCSACSRRCNHCPEPHSSQPLRSCLTQVENPAVASARLDPTSLVSHHSHHCHPLYSRRCPLVVSVLQSCLEAWCQFDRFAMNNSPGPPVSSNVRAPRGTQLRPTFSASAARPAPRSKATRSVASRQLPHSHSSTVDGSSYAHSVTQKLSATSRSPASQPYSGYTASQHNHAASSSVYPSTFPHAVTLPPPSYASPPPVFTISPHHAPLSSYSPRPSHATAAAIPPHSPVFVIGRTSSPPVQLPMSQSKDSIYAVQSSGRNAGRGYVPLQSVQPARHVSTPSSTNEVSVSLFDESDSQRQTVQAKPIEEEKTEEVQQPTEVAQADLRATCQRFILALPTKQNGSSGTPPWRLHHDQNNPIVAEYEALYSQMLTLSPPPAATADRSSTHLSVSSSSPPPASSRLSVDSHPRPSNDRRQSRLSQISTAIRARLGNEPTESPPQRSSSPQSHNGHANTLSINARHGSITASPRTSFSLLIPSFSTLHAVAKVMQLTSRVRRAKGAAKKEAGENWEEKQKDEESEEDEAIDDRPSTSHSAMEDEHHHTHLTIDCLQSHSATPSPRLSTKPVLPSVSPYSATVPASPSAHSIRVFRSRYEKQQELSRLQHQTSAHSKSAHTAHIVAREQNVSAFSYTTPLPRAPVSTGSAVVEQNGKQEEKQAHAATNGSRARTLSKSSSASAAESAAASAKSPHKQIVAIVTPPAKSTAQLRSLATLPPLPPLPASLLTRNFAASTSSFSKTAPVSPVARSTTASKSVSSIPSTSKPPITHHRFHAPMQPRPLLVRSDQARQLYSEKLEATEHSDKATRQRKAAEEKRRHRREQLMEKPVKKWGRRGWPHKSRLHVTADGQLQWNWKSGDKSASDGRCLALKGVRAVVPGLSPVEHKSVAFATSVLCFSVLGSERVLGCECASVRERDDWMEELRVDVGEAKTRGCVWSGRVLMSIERDPTIDCVVADEDKDISFI